MQEFLTSFPFPPSVDRPPRRNGRPEPDSSFHHQKADAVKDKISFGPKGLPEFDAGFVSEFGWADAESIIAGTAEPLPNIEVGQGAPRPACVGQRRLQSDIMSPETQEPGVEHSGFGILVAGSAGGGRGGGLRGGRGVAQAVAPIFPRCFCAVCRHRHGRWSGVPGTSPSGERGGRPRKLSTGVREGGGEASQAQLQKQEQVDGGAYRVCTRCR